jgi:hypothetical protein
MNIKAVFSFIVSCLVFGFAAVGLAYCAGRWHVVSFVGAELFSGLSAFAVMFLLLFFLKVQGKLRHVAAYCSVCCVLIASQRVVFNPMLRSYARGFERTAFSIASLDEWHTLVPLAGEWLASGSGKSFDDMLPQFTRKVYFNNNPYSGVTGDVTPDFHDLSVAVWWRGPTLCIGVEVGKQGGFAGELYREQYTNGLFVVIFRGG